MMNLTRLRMAMLLGGALSLCSGSASAYTITAFDSATIAAGASIDSVVGLAGFVVEDFEDTALEPGLSYLDPLTGAMLTTLPNLFSRFSAGANGNMFWIDDPWDGDHVLSNFTQNLVTSDSDDLGPLTLLLSTPASSVAVGLSNFQSPATGWVINGVTLGVLGGLPEISFGLGHSGFIRIDVEAGDAPIGTFGLIPSSVDAVSLDHFAYLPEPCTGWLVVTGLLLIKRRARKNGLVTG